jgi:S1-C subfamily serine protease
MRGGTLAARRGRVRAGQVRYRSYILTNAHVFADTDEVAAMLITWRKCKRKNVGTDAALP